jgi:membrane peptidoglycan carboxypeptidase
VSYAGYTPELSTFSIIAGVKKNGSPKSLAGVTINDTFLNFGAVGGSSLAGPMWKKAMGTIQDQLSPVNFRTPPERQPVAKKKEPKKDQAAEDSGDE